MSKIAILSRYKENNINWHNTLINYGYDIIVFNKYSGNNLLSNVGRESHTYLYYITQNYNNLPDEILFSQYDPFDHFRDASREQKHNSEIYFLQSYLYDFIGIRPGQFPYICGAGKHIIKWLDLCEKIFDKKLSDIDINKIVSTGPTLNGIFRVSKQAILSHDLSFYQRCLNMLLHSSNPIEGYFFERIWRFLFTNYGNIDINDIKYQKYIDRPLLYKHKSHRSIVFNNTFGHIKLYNDGTVASNDIVYYKHKNERFWAIANKHILLFDYAGGLTNRIYLNNNMPLHIDTYSVSEQIWKKNNGVLNLALQY